MIQAYITRLNEGDGKVKAFLSIDIDNLLKINNCRYIVSEKGEFVGMPYETYVNQNGETVYKETVQLSDNIDFRTLILNAAKQAYQNYVYLQKQQAIERPAPFMDNPFGDKINKEDVESERYFSKTDHLPSLNMSI